MSDEVAQLDPAAVKPAGEWKYEPSPLISCRFDPSGRYVFAGAQDRNVVRLDRESGNLVTLAAHESWVRAIGFSPDGQQCWTGGYDGRLIQWETAAERPAPLRQIDAHQGWLRMLDVSPDGRWLATGGNDHQVRIWDHATGSEHRTCSGHDRHVYSVLFTPDSKSLYSGDLRGVVKKWDVESGSELETLDAQQLYTPNPGQGAEYGGVRSLALQRDEGELACGGLHNGSNPFGAVQEPLVVVLDTTDKKTRRIHTAKDAPKAICWRAVYHPGGTLLGGCGGSAGGMICFWKPDAETEYHRHTLPNTVLDLDLTPNGSFLVTVHYDRHFRITGLS